jgi:SAM-dependent methyltransferase
MTIWHDDDAFWALFAPFIFSEERWRSTAAEIDQLTALIDLAPGTAVLDLGCGPGRHSLELARRGCRVTGVDRTALYLQQARAGAQKESLDVEFVQADMRQFARPASFELAINLYTTFGYFAAAADNIQVLRNVYASLRPGGVFVIEMSGKEVLARVFRERDWQEHEGVIVLEQRRIIDNWRQIENEWTVISGAERQHYKFSHWTYSAAELQGMLEEVGFASINIYDGLQGGSYDQNAKRLTAVAVRS